MIDVKRSFAVLSSVTMIITMVITSIDVRTKLFSWLYIINSLRKFACVFIVSSLLKPCPEKGAVAKQGIV